MTRSFIRLTCGYMIALLLGAFVIALTEALKPGRAQAINHHLSNYSLTDCSPFNTA